MREQGHVPLVALLDVRMAVNDYILELDVIEHAFLCIRRVPVLGSDLDFVVVVLLDNLLHALLKESIEGGDLLRDKAMLLEIGADDLPAVIVIDRLHV